MNESSLLARLEFVRNAEKLKDTLRSAHTTCGRVESVAEHSWRLALLAMSLADYWPEADLLKLLKLCVLHDLGEAIHGDIPAPQQSATIAKAHDERRDLISILNPLPTELQAEFLGLWDEYENATSLEAKIAKALDKIETILQHNQGKNPPDFDYQFNLGYGRKQTDELPLTARLRSVLDEATRSNMRDSDKS